MLDCTGVETTEDQPEPEPVEANETKGERILVYRYGLAAPHENAPVIAEQMRMAHAHRNAWIAIERGRRAAVRAIEEPLLADARTAFAEASARYAAASEKMRAWRIETGKRRVPDELREAKETAGAAMGEARTRFFAERRANQPALRGHVDALGERAKELRNNARAYSGLAKFGPYRGAFGTYQLAELSADASAQKTPLYDDCAPNDPKFARWCGDGAVSVQIQGGVSVERALFGEHRQLRITAPGSDAWEHPKRAKRRAAARTAAIAMRLGDAADGTPLWGRWRLDMHRPLPAGAVIKRATVHRRMRGPHAEWSLSLTIVFAKSRRPAVAPLRGGAVAVDLGWRLMPDRSLRVAAWVDEHGAAGDLCLDFKTLARLTRAERIQGERDERFNAVRAQLLAWVAAVQIVQAFALVAGKPFEGVPEGLLALVRRMPAWRSQRRLVGFQGEWRGHRFQGDERMYGIVEAWAARDRHEWATEERGRVRALRRRREIYRCFAAQLGDRYETVLLEDMDLRTLTVRVDDDETRNEVAAHHRQLAAVSELRDAIVYAALARGRLARGYAAADTTRTCHECGLVTERPSAATDVIVACECGATWDQDTNACRVLLARWRERPGDALDMAIARKARSQKPGGIVETKRDRVRRLRKEKEARMEAARQTVANLE